MKALPAKFFQGYLVFCLVVVCGAYLLLTPKRKKSEQAVHEICSALVWDPSAGSKSEKMQALSKLPVSDSDRELIEAFLGTWDSDKPSVRPSYPSANWSGNKVRIYISFSEPEATDPFVRITLCRKEGIWVIAETMYLFD